jgi:hypothetical protein
MSPKANQQRVLSKPRIVAGVLSEIDAAGVLLIFQEKNSESYWTARLSCEFRVPFEDSVIRVKGDTIQVGSYQVSALFAGQRLSFEIDIQSSMGDCGLPREIKVVDLRRQRRRKFGPETEFAEIFTDHGIVMATPIDMSQNSIALLAVSDAAKLVPGQKVKLLIRGDTSGRDIFSAFLVVKEFEPNGESARILLGPVNPKDDVSGRGLLRVVPRHPTGQSSFILSPADDHLGEPVLATVTDVSLNGFQCSTENYETLAWLMPGATIKIKDLGLHATIVWTLEGRAGMRVNSLETTDTIGKWTEVLRSFKISSGFHHSQVDELVNLFTESGLLKGKRRKLFGKTPGGFLPPDSFSENTLLYQRMTALNKDSRIYGHISMARLCDDLWYFQEGAHTGDDSKTYRDLYIQTILTARSMYHATLLAPRYLAGLFHSDIKSAGTFGEELFSDTSSRVYQLMQISIAQSTAPSESRSNVKIIDPSDLDADQRRTTLAPLDATLCEAFLGWNGAHPRLNAELAKIGPHHNAKTLVVRDGNETVGLAFRLSSYYALNSTGVMNSLFLIVRPDTNTEQIKSALTKLVDLGFTFGTDDVAVIACARPSEPVQAWNNLVQPKPFTFFVIDNRLNRVFLGAKVELPENENLKQRRRS